MKRMCFGEGEIGLGVLDEIVDSHLRLVQPDNMVITMGCSPVKSLGMVMV